MKVNNLGLFDVVIKFENGIIEKLNDVLKIVTYFSALYGKECISFQLAKDKKYYVLDTIKSINFIER